MKKLSIIVPCYNESKNIALLLDRFGIAIGERSDIELIAVNNGSTDDSAAIFEQELPQYPFARVVTVTENQGYGFGILSGLRAAEGEWIGWTHADLQTDPSDVVKALSIIEKQEDPQSVYIKGNRKGRPFFDQFFTMGMSAFESLYMGTALWDINAQPNIFHRSFFETWKNPPHDFSLDLYALYMAKKQHRILIRFDVVFPERVHGSSSWNTGLASKWKFIKRTIDFSRTLKKNL